ncbi:type IV secretion protein Rhs, partial [Flavobacterium sp. IR1]
IEVKPAEGLEDLLFFNNRNDYVLHFSGIVTKIKTRKSRFEDLEETLFISGHSCSILLDDGLKCNSFHNKSLNDIVTEAKAGYDIDLNIFPFYKNILPYTVQYNETTFDFLNRLAKRYGHYFYDNGRVMVFGAPGTSGGEP